MYAGGAAKVVTSNGEMLECIKNAHKEYTDRKAKEEAEKIVKTA